MPAGSSCTTEAFAIGANNESSIGNAMMNPKEGRVLIATTLDDMLTPSRLRYPS
jgi:hypothetical protein